MVISTSRRTTTSTRSSIGRLLELCNAHLSVEHYLTVHYLTYRNTLTDCYIANRLQEPSSVCHTLATAVAAPMGNECAVANLHLNLGWSSHLWWVV
jgi:hypothetical protein